MEELKKYSKLHIYLTAYGPFAHFQTNPTQELLETIIKNKNEYETNKTSIDFNKVFEVTVDYVNKNFHIVEDEVNKNNINKDELHLIISYGQADIRNLITIESQSENFIYDLIIKQKIDMNLNEKYIKSLVNVEKIVEIINKDNIIQCEVSNDAGTYLCNYIYFKSIEFCKKNKDNVKSIFVHIPLFKNLNLEKNLLFFKELIKAFEKLYLN